MFYAYILASKRNGTLYLGHTDDLGERILQHKLKANYGFSSRHNCVRLVWFETHETRESAFKRERQMKKWNRAWKLRRIETNNPEWDDLYDYLTTDQVYHPRHQFQVAKL
ncbi:MAG: GIY-YIG nuclease [Robiginitomaculum sp.]|nr:MAG: GIY-YIG nuclease [Robiginitomaculum sp.]